MVEWKYNRARVYMEFEDEAHAVPPPFNFIWTLVGGCATMWRTARQSTAKWQWPTGVVVDAQVREHAEQATAYNALMLRLYERYRQHSQQSWKCVAELETGKIDTATPSIIGRMDDMKETK